MGSTDLLLLEYSNNNSEGSNFHIIAFIVLNNYCTGKVQNSVPEHLEYCGMQ